MRAIIHNPLGNSLLPLLGLATAYTLAPFSRQLPGQVLLQLPLLPYFLTFAVVALGLLYRRPRSGLFALLLALYYATLTGDIGKLWPALARQPELPTLLGAWLALAMLLLALFHEHHLRPLLGLLVLLAALLAGSHAYAPALLQGLLAAKPPGTEQLPAWINLPPVVLLIFASSAGGMLLLIALRQQVFERLFLACLFTVALALNQSASTSAQDLAVLFGLAQILLLAGLLHHAYVIAYRDELTGLPGRRALNEALSRLRGPYALAMLDVDHFKKFNDRHGHDVGDQVLRLVASKMRRLPGRARAYRYGGEEFCVVLPGRESAKAQAVLEDLRATIAESRLVLRQAPRGKSRKQGTARVTISIGLADNTGGQTSESVIKTADQALYRAKKNGRNRVCSARSG